MESVLSINHQVTFAQQERRGALNGTLGRVLNRVFGCWQHNLSRPFSNNGRTYRICVNCGMSRDFDTASWKTHGHYQPTGPGIVYPNVRTLRRVPTKQKPLPQRVISFGSLKQEQQSTGYNTGFAA
ncbi:MAG: hypothetical protein DMF69_18225 [Acidobacteria bacterium]|nr:MAG: hypothetical protein DMF69_18225 [Acidobacteriota bacterium]